MNQYEYFIHALNFDEKIGIIKSYPGVEKKFQLSEGLPMGDCFPENVELTIAPESGNIITDFIENNTQILIVSERVKKFFIENGLNEALVEYLPFILKNKNGNIVHDRQYYVANLLCTIDCLDRKRSNFRALKDGSEIVVIRSLYLDLEKIPSDACLFRLGELPKHIIFRSDLLNSINKLGFTGLCVVEQGKIR